MSKQITEAIKTAKKIAVFELEKIMYNIIIDNAGRVDALKLEHGNIYAYLRGTKLAPEDVKKLGEILMKFRPELESHKRNWQRITEKEYLRLARKHGALFQVFDITQ